eukprot:292325-Pyramimonas_sp.AAC.1
MTLASVRRSAFFSTSPLTWRSHNPQMAAHPAQRRLGSSPAQIPWQRQRLRLQPARFERPAKQGAQQTGANVPRI